jgi:hypothetical protein
MEKPSLKYEDGKLKASASIGIDKDKDGVNSVSLKAELEINAMEAVNEIIKDGVPEWLKNLLGQKEV